MKTIRIFLAALIFSALCLFLPNAANALHIQNFSKPVSGDMQLIFHGTNGPFRVEIKCAVDEAWRPLAGAKVTEMQPGVYMAFIPQGSDDMALYRVISETAPNAELKGWAILMSVSKPANGDYFAVGESPVVTATILDTLGGLGRDAFSGLNLYMYGPQNPLKTVSAIKLLNANTNRAARPHHYIDLRSNTNAVLNGNTITYKLQPVTDETPGTYTISLYATLAADPIQQMMIFSDVQIATGNVEKPVVGTSNCASCHYGPVSKKLYMHHIDPGYSPVGSWALDQEPVRSCKACHNNDGYASITVNGSAVNDPIVRRVHGVHMGEGLTSDFNTNPTNGDFKDYTHVAFPPDVRNCTTCHLDDRWKNNPSRQACGSCHDNIWFGPVADKPATMLQHGGGPRTTDLSCGSCHPAQIDGEYEYYWPIANSHKVDPPVYQVDVALSMTPPANGKFYVAGEAPKVTVQLKNSATGAIIDPATIKEPLISTNVQPNEWRRGNLFVSGPRSKTVPVLTTAAAIASPTASYANNDVRVRVKAINEDPKVTRTTDSITYQLSDVAGLAPGTYTTFVAFQPANGLGGSKAVQFQVGSATVEPLIAGNCTDCHKDTKMHVTSTSIPFDTDLCKNCHDYKRQQPGKVGWGSSNNGFGAAPISRRVHGVHFGNYLDKPTEVHRTSDYSHVIFPTDVRNCTKCHSQSNSWNEKPSRLACLACHDSDSAVFHGALMTWDPTPADPWSGDEVETCVICHGSDSEYNAKSVHAISNPYIPPYPREPRE